MPLLERITTLIRADAHGALESIEDRRLLLQQCLRDARAELDRKAGRLQRLQEDQRRLRRDAQQLEQAEQALDDDVQLALAQDKPELARFAIRKLLPVRETQRRVQLSLQRCAEQEGELAQQLAAQQSELELLRVRAQAISTCEQLAGLGDAGEVSIVSPGVVSDEAVELELLRRRVDAKESA